VKDHLKTRGQAVLNDVAGGRPIVPAVLSGVTLALTEARDFFSWKEAATSTPAAGVASTATSTTVPATAPATVQTTIDQTTATAPGGDTVAQIYSYLHNLAASVP